MVCLTVALACSDAKRIRGDVRFERKGVVRNGVIRDDTRAMICGETRGETLGVILGIVLGVTPGETLGLTRDKTFCVTFGVICGVTRGVNS
jgi:hypothetical protein